MELVGTGLRWHHVDMATRDLDRLAKRVKAHRLELYSSRKAAADAARVSKDTWQRVEEGLTVREGTYAKIDKALGWSIGSCIAIAEGEEPLLVAGEEAAPAAHNGDRHSAGALRQAAFEAAKAKLPNVSVGDIGAFSDELVEILRRAGEVEDAG